ncbi:MAG: hypothetical protein ABFS24_14070 [Pseudomonadota bacterium]
MKQKSKHAELIVYNDRTLLLEVASEIEVLENEILREQTTNGPDTPRIAKLRKLQSAALKRVLGKLLHNPGKPWAQSRAKLKLIRQQTED